MIAVPTITDRLLESRFLRLWIGSTASGLATWALPFVLGLAIVSGDISAVDTGLALAARTLGFVVVMPVSGVLADRSGPRRMILVACLIVALSMFPIIGGIMGMGALAVIAGSLIAGLGQGSSRAAYQAIVPTIVAGSARQKANAALTISVRVGTLAGPALATAIALHLGVAAALVVIAILWLTSAFLPSWPTEAALALREGSFKFWRDIGEGFTEAGRHPWFVAGLTALTTVVAFGYSVTNVLLPQISESQAGGPQLMALSVTSYTLGALAGAVLVSRWQPRAMGWIALLGLSAYGLVPLSLLVAQHMAVPLMAFFIAGVGIEVFNVPWFTATQREVPADRLARVTSIDFLFSFGLAPLALAGLTPLAGWIGIHAVLLICGLACLVAPLIAMLAKGSKRFSVQGH
jgi:MFS family permease